MQYEIDFERLFHKRWKSNIATELGEEYEVIAPGMPNAMNAKYAEWKIYFEKYIPYIQDGVIIVGHSLGGIFLAKYLSENTFPKRITATALVAAPFEGRAEYSLADFILPQSLELFQNQSPHIFLYHSEDDPTVPFDDVHKYAAKLPKAIVKTFKDRGHFNQEEFPELIEEIRNSP